MPKTDANDLPVKPVQAWADSRGHLYQTKAAALYVEIERLLGHVGTGESLAPGIARLLVSKRDQLSPLLEAFDDDAAEVLEAIPVPAARKE